MKYLFLVAFLFYISANITFAENLDLKVGIKDEEVVLLLGSPEKKLFNGQGTQKWYYGESVLFIRDSKLVAIFSRPNLNRRLSLKRVELNYRKREMDGTFLLVEEWERPQILSKDKELDILLSN